MEAGVISLNYGQNFAQVFQTYDSQLRLFSKFFQDDSILSLTAERLRDVTLTFYYEHSTTALRILIDFYHFIAQYRSKLLQHE